MAHVLFEMVTAAETSLANLALKRSLSSVRPLVDLQHVLVGVRPVANLASEQLFLADILFRSSCLDVHYAVFLLHVDDVRGDVVRG